MQIFVGSGITRPTTERLIVALDTPTLNQARELIKQLAPHVGYFKVGSELFLAAGVQAIEMVKQAGAKVFLDLKFHDIPNTVAKAVEQAVNYGVDMLTIHTSGGVGMMSAASEAAAHRAVALGQSRPLVLGVTVLTSMTDEDLHKEGYAQNVSELVATRARLAEQAGIDGLVCSPQELKLVKEKSKLLTVVPGIRPLDRGDDQKRTSTPADAIQAGADFLVVGRPITAAPKPWEAALEILAQMKDAAEPQGLRMQIAASAYDSEKGEQA
ncbi:MAG: orotidine-5'-phosphate decarboxylase [Bacillota bacterium]